VWVVFNAPTVYTDPSGQLPFLFVFAIAALAARGAGPAGYTAWESYQATGTPFNVEIWLAAATGLGEGAMATVDGIVPFADPFAYYGMYDPNDPVLQSSQTMGELARDLLILAWVPSASAWRTWIRNPFWYEVGSTTVPASVWRVIEEMSVVERGKYLWVVITDGPLKGEIGEVRKVYEGRSL
jgi:hypothetical protein